MKLEGFVRITHQNTTAHKSIHKSVDTVKRSHKIMKIILSSLVASFCPSRWTQSKDIPISTPTAKSINFKLPLKQINDESTILLMFSSFPLITPRSALLGPMQLNSAIKSMGPIFFIIAMTKSKPLPPFISINSFKLKNGDGTVKYDDQFSLFSI